MSPKPLFVVAMGKEGQLSICVKQPYAMSGLDEKTQSRGLNQTEERVERSAAGDSSYPAIFQTVFRRGDRDREF